MLHTPLVLASAVSKLSAHLQICELAPKAGVEQNAATKKEPHFGWFLITFSIPDINNLKLIFAHLAYCLREDKFHGTVFF